MATAAGTPSSRVEQAVGAAAPSWRSPVLLDVLAAVGVCAASVVALVVSDEPRARQPDLGAFVLLGAAAAALIGRRRWPVGVLGVAIAVAMVTFAAGYPGGPVTIPLLAGIYVAAAAGRRRWAWAAAGLFALGGTVFRLFVEGDPLVAVGLNAALFVLVALLGDAVDGRRTLRREVTSRLRHAAAEQEREAQRRVLDERMRIARELHDVMAHTISTMTVQAGVAADSLDDSPEDAREALRTMRGSARQAMAELRATVSVLREGSERSPLVPAPGLGDLPTLIDTVTAQGLAVEVGPVTADQPLPASTDLTAYRIIQEALTNVIRHAAADKATLTLEWQAAAVVITIDDDGCASAGDTTAGFGIRGMAERAEAVGGSLTAGPRPDGGFRVEARLPVGDHQP